MHVIHDHVCIYSRNRETVHLLTRSYQMMYFQWIPYLFIFITIPCQINGLYSQKAYVICQYLLWFHRTTLSLTIILTTWFSYSFWYWKDQQTLSLLNGHFDYPHLKFYISSYLLPCRKLGFYFFFNINTFMCALKWGHMFLFQNKYFGNKFLCRCTHESIQAKQKSNYLQSKWYLKCQILIRVNQSRYLCTFTLSWYTADSWNSDTANNMQNFKRQMSSYKSNINKTRVINEKKIILNICMDGSKILVLMGMSGKILATQQTCGSLFLRSLDSSDMNDARKCLLCQVSSESM
jgi:hypothetical protein